MAEPVDRRSFLGGSMFALGGLVGAGCGGGGGGTPGGPYVTPAIGRATLKDDVVYIPETTAVEVSRIDDSDVQLVGAIPPLAVGTLLLLSAGDGFAGRIQKLQDITGGVRCQCNPVTFAEIFAEADFAYKGTLPPESFTFLEDNPAGTSLTRGAARPGATREVIQWSLRGSANFDWATSAQTVAVRNNCEVGLDIDLAFDANLTDGVTLFRFVPELRVKGDTTFVFFEPDKQGGNQIQLAKVEKRWRRFAGTLVTPVILPPPLPPLIIKWLLVGTLSSNAEIVADATCQWPIEWTGRARYGTEYTLAQGWKNITDFSGTWEPQLPHMHGSIQANASLLVFNGNAYAFGIGGPQIEVTGLRGSMEAEYHFPNLAERGYATWKTSLESAVAGGIGFRKWISPVPSDIVIEGDRTWYEKEVEIKDSGVIDGTIS